MATSWNEFSGYDPEHPNWTAKDEIRFSDAGCGCCGSSSTYKGQKAIDELTSHIADLQFEIDRANKLIEEIRATEAS